MITVKKISKTKLPELVALSYKDDQELFDKYHIAKLNFDGAVVSTLGLIHDASQKMILNYYKVIYKQQPIGYFVTFEGCLYSFGIAIKFRIKDVLIGWFESVKKVLGNHFRALLYENNTRAIDHLKKQGMKIFNIENNVVTLIN